MLQTMLHYVGTTQECLIMGQMAAPPPSPPPLPVHTFPFDLVSRYIGLSPPPVTCGKSINTHVASGLDNMDVMTTLTKHISL